MQSLRHDITVKDNFANKSGKKVPKSIHLSGKYALKWENTQ